MKRIVLSLLFLLLPVVSWAADSCTNPKDYTVDKRCYVTEEQKKIKPYNAVVPLLDDKAFVRCTGTIVNRDDKMYIYTAKHCFKDEEEKLNLPDFLTVQTLDNQKITAIRVSSGAKGQDTDLVEDDWAIFAVIDNDSLPYVNISNLVKTNVKFLVQNYDARVVGYGALKIMSDKEIEDFKQKYVDYLKYNLNIETNGTEEYFDWHKGGVNLASQGKGYGSNFVEYLKENAPSYYNSVFLNGAMLKTSQCVYTSQGERKNCQTWGGDSGSGLFDKDGNIMAIHSRGVKIVGGKLHIGKGTLMSNGSVMLLETPKEKMKNRLEKVETKIQSLF